MKKRILIIGGVAGGASTASRLRRLDESAEIIMFERGSYISYANCGLPYHIGGTIKERSSLILQKPEDMSEKYNVDVRVESEVITIDKENKLVEVKKTKAGETYKESYDTLVISTGSSPIKPPIEGINSPGIFTLWTIPDTDEIKKYISEKKPKKAAVIGGGFIGLEMAENLHEAGLEVTVVEMLDQVIAPVDYEMAQLVQNNMDMNGVILSLGDGDVIEVEEFICKDKAMVPLAGPANKQGRICANNICGANEEYQGTQGTSVAKVFDLTVASTGASELILKLIFSPDGKKIFGAQIVGEEGADKRIDTISTAIRLNASIYDLKELELAYAPPYSSAKDPVNMLGFVAENIITGKINFSKWDDIDPEKSSKYTFLDIREDVELLVYTMPNAKHIPLGKLRTRLSELNKDDDIIVFCAVGIRSYNAARTLMENGFKNVKVYPAGTNFYKAVYYKYFNHLNPSTTIDNVNNSKQSINYSTNDVSSTDIKASIKVDCSGLQCPGPIMKVYETMNKMNDGDIIEVSATDSGFARDVEAWCRRTGNTLLKTEKNKKENIVFLQKGTELK